MVAECDKIILFYMGGMTKPMACFRMAHDLPHRVAALLIDGSPF